MIKTVLAFLLLLAATEAAAKDPIVIAHRGASGYLPEHTLESKALAYAMRPDYIEQDLVLSKDDQLIVMHDIHLDNTTNVHEVFPDRARKGGRYYTIDFTLDELKRLRVTEPFITADGTTRAKYPGRFPLWNRMENCSTTTATGCCSPVAWRKSPVSPRVFVGLGPYVRKLARAALRNLGAGQGSRPLCAS